VTDVHKGFDRPALKHQLDAAGFPDVKFSRVHEVIRQVDGVEKAFPLFLMIARKTS
jgi:hypothetical protein